MWSGAVWSGSWSGAVWRGGGSWLHAGASAGASLVGAGLGCFAARPARSFGSLACGVLQQGQVHLKEQSGLVWVPGIKLKPMSVLVGNDQETFRTIILAWLCFGWPVS